MNLAGRVRDGLRQQHGASAQGRVQSPGQSKAQQSMRACVHQRQRRRGGGLRAHPADDEQIAVTQAVDRRACGCIGAGQRLHAPESTRLGRQGRDESRDTHFGRLDPTRLR